MGTEKNSIIPQSSLDRRLLRMAAKYATPQEMSEAVLGKLTPAQAADRVREILQSKTVLDEVMERRLALYQMAEHLDWLKSNRSTDNAAILSQISRMYKLVSDQIERANINITDVSTKLATEHARYFADAISIGFEKVIRAIEERDDIIIEENEVMELMQIGTGASAEYLNRVTSRGEDD